MSTSSAIDRFDALIAQYQERYRVPTNDATRMVCVEFPKLRQRYVQQYNKLQAYRKAERARQGGVR